MIAGAAVVATAVAVAAPAQIPVRPCSSRAEGERPIAFALPGDVVIGPASFRGLARLATTEAFETMRNGTVYAVKAGVGIRAARTVTVSIAVADRAHASLAYVARSLRGVADGAPAVRFRACRRSEPAFAYHGSVGPVTGFGGGFILDGPRCVTLIVRDETRRATFRRLVSFGAGRCD